MKKERNIDFTLFEDKDEKIIFRFLPRQSNCHSFGSEPPKDWNDVYKVYYSYKIFHRWKDDNYHSVLFDCICDECSVINEVAERIKHIVNGESQVTVIRNNTEYTIELFNNEVFPIGDGVSWTINECSKKDLYQIVMYRYDDVGYRFYLEKEQLKQFGEFLNKCCEYMLVHGDPI